SRWLPELDGRIAVERCTHKGGRRPRAYVGDDDSLVADAELRTEVVIAARAVEIQGSEREVRRRPCPSTTKQHDKSDDTEGEESWGTLAHFPISSPHRPLLVYMNRRVKQANSVEGAIPVRSAPAAPRLGLRSVRRSPEPEYSGPHFRG